MIEEILLAGGPDVFAEMDVGALEWRHGRLVETKKDKGKGKGKGKDKGKGKGEGKAPLAEGEEMSEEQLKETIAHLRSELDHEREERNYFQLERDKINTFWEISKKELEDRKAELRNKDREMEELEERHQVSDRDPLRPAPARTPAPAAKGAVLGC